MSNQHADKRSVATDALETLGTIIDENQKRDAIHLAVEPVIATERLLPGQDIGIFPGGLAGPSPGNEVGIVDPFLDEPVEAGQRFWLVVYPRVITSLRHVWTHPSFTDEALAQPTADTPSREASEAWLKELAERAISYGSDRFVDLIRGLENGGYFSTDIEYSDEFRPDNEDLVFHYENYTGKKAAWADSGREYFSCSC